jgi:hypothetical protein
MKTEVPTGYESDAFAFISRDYKTSLVRRGMA